MYILKFYLYAITIYAGLAQNDNKTVEYYERLINEQVAKAQLYDVPINSYAYRPKSLATRDLGTFDFIVVGSGSAGSVVASRLSEKPNWKVLLIEAGDYENDFSDIPGMHFYLQGLRSFNWNYNSTQQSSCCLGMKDRKCAVPRGKAVGGTSTINGLVYVRGNKRDFDDWAAQGNQGWSYEEILPFFIKSENSQIQGDPGYHGTNGTLNVEYHRPISPQLDAFLAANEELGRRVLDYNGREQLGVSRSQLNTINGRRDSAGKAFINPAKERPNLRILTNSYVTKILINPITKTATGVQFSNGEHSYSARARKEVIVSAGAINSPQVLMLSGIGPAAHLKKLGIPVIRNLAVGDNYYDHPTYYGLYFNTNSTEPARTGRNYIEQYLNGEGQYAIALNSQGLGFFQTNLTNITGYPDVELLVIPSNSSNSYNQKAFHVTDETYNAVWGSVNPQTAMCVYVILLHPKSKGTVRLASKNPYEYPLINHNFYTDREGEDIKTMLAGIDLAIQLLQTNAFKKINASLFRSDYPQCRQHDYLSKEYWYCAIGILSSHLYHPMGTCKMGPLPSKGAVVDNKLKVHGIKRLRVADASIIPTPISAHTNAPAMMIGEVISEFIKREWE